MNLREQLESMGQVRYSDGRPHEVVFTIRQWERVVAILELYDEKWISIEKSLTKKCDDLTQERDEQKIVALPEIVRREREDHSTPTEQLRCCRLSRATRDPSLRKRGCAAEA